MQDPRSFAARKPRYVEQIKVAQEHTFDEWLHWRFARAATGWTTRLRRGRA